MCDDVRAVRQKTHVYCTSSEQKPAQQDPQKNLLLKVYLEMIK